MFLDHRRCQAACIATLAGALLMLGALPGRAQQSTPAARHSAPATAAAGRTTNVPVQFDLPPGHTLARFPRLRVQDSHGRLRELRPVYVTQKPPAGRGQRTLNTGTYPKGTYQVRLEVDFLDKAGKPGTVVSPWSTLTVPGR